ncbi:bifunctional nuclease family protein [Cellulomonas sp. DKR-3]|uniref:Bifunctional nuclease family protein n=1 Tax=Cellulomonas fulva TaxID=2835530 RepID=A0ABS5U143_9CELL|nr:bifunctional nuclease family protein [Cellulomonas fulva]
MVVVEVVGVRRHPAVEEIVVLLLDAESELVVPIMIGPAEAGAIAAAQAGVVPPRPMTHDLLRDLLVAAGEQVVGVRITRLTEGVFHAEIELGNGARVDARASDAIAVALRFGVPVRCSAEIVALAGIEVVVTDGAEGAEEDVERFREFLDQVTPEDFETGKEPEGG